jgi:hypothetical protein
MYEVITIHFLLERLLVDRVERVDLTEGLDFADLELARVAAGLLTSFALRSSSLLAFFLELIGFGGKPSATFLVRFLV